MKDMLRFGLASPRISTSILVAVLAGCSPGKPQALYPKQVGTEPQADVCGCPLGRAGELASALCWRYRSADVVEGTFELRDSAGVAGGAVVRARDARGQPSLPEIAFDERTDDTVVATSTEVATILGFLSRPLCRNAQLALHSGENFGYTRGPILLAHSGVDLVVYIDAQTSTVHGASFRRPNGERILADFSQWTFFTQGARYVVPLDEALDAPQRR
jgi:hypothetical protein